MKLRNLFKPFRLVSAKLDRLGWILAGLFAIISVQRFWVHPSGGHVHRQSDTIGMSIEFAEQIKERGLVALDFLIYPRVLQRGLLDGINASEFPLLNAVGSPGFLMSMNPWIGVFLTSLMVLAFNFCVAYFFLPKLLKAWSVEATGPICLLLWLAGGTLASQTNVIMPEGVAFPLVLAGMVQLLESRGRVFSIGFGALLCSLGVAAKPTAVIALGAIVVLPLLREERRSQWKPIIIGSAISLIFPAWWYTVHARHLLRIAQGPQIFALAGFNPIQKLAEVGWSGLFFLLRREPYQGQFPMFVGWFFVVAGLFLGEWIPVVLYFLSLLAAISLDGAHIYVHMYYFIGTCVFAMILMARVLGAAQGRRFLSTLTVVFLAWGVVYNIRGNIWVWARDSQYWKVNFWSMGAEARKIIHRNYHLITDDGVYPQKLLFIGRSGTAAGSKVYKVCQEPQFAGLSLAIVSDDPPPGASGPCGARQFNTRYVETNYAKWYITLVP
jgi:hypothetical protein